MGGQGAHFLDQTALKPKVRLETIAEIKPVQLKVKSDAEASATPICTNTHTEPWERCQLQLDKQPARSTHAKGSLAVQMSQFAEEPEKPFKILSYTSKCDAL